MSVIPAASFKDRLAQKRRELVEKSVFELAVPGYEELGLYARYRVLGYTDVRQMGLRNEGEAQTTAEGERNTAADVLAEACVGLLEKTGVDEEGKPVFTELGYRWTANAARDLFGIELPEGVLDRTAIQSIFPYPHDMPMMRHFNDYMTEADMGNENIEETLLGESPAA